MKNRFRNILQNQLNILNKFLNFNITSRVKEKTKKGSNVVNLPKFEISKFSGDSTHWQSFYDSFNTAVGQSTSVSGIEKLNYFTCYLERDSLQAIAGFVLTNGNYEEALELQKNKLRTCSKLYPRT